METLVKFPFEKRVETKAMTDGKMQDGGAGEKLIHLLKQQDMRIVVILPF